MAVDCLASHLLRKQNKFLLWADIGYLSVIKDCIPIIFLRGAVSQVYAKELTCPGDKYVQVKLHVYSGAYAMHS